MIPTPQGVPWLCLLSAVRQGGTLRSHRRAKGPLIASEPHSPSVRQECGLAGRAGHSAGDLGPLTPDHCPDPSQRPYREALSLSWKSSHLPETNGPPTRQPPATRAMGQEPLVRGSVGGQGLCSQLLYQVSQETTQEPGEE